MTATIASLAAEYDMEPHAVRAALYLGDAYNDETPIEESEGWTDEEAHYLLALMAEQAAEARA